MMGSLDTSSSQDVHQVVIIGASFGGIPAAHGLLKDVFPALSASGKQKYRVVLIAPNDQFYWKIGAPRLIVKPDALPMGKALIPIAEGFKQYPKDQYEFIHAFATSIDPNARTVATSSNTIIHYDSLVIASGTTYANSVWTTSNGMDALRADLADLHDRLPAASSIVVAGGGAVGVETLGELGEVYGRKKEMTLLSGSIQLLPRLGNKAVGKDAEARLTKQGVKVIHNVRVASTKKTATNQISLRLSDGSEMVVDVYIDATGDKPNNSFVPKQWLNEKGYVKTNGATLRMDVPGLQNVYCVGAVGSHSDGSALDTKFSMKALVESMRLDLGGKREKPSSSTVSTDPNSSGWFAWLTSWFYGTTESGPRKIFYKKIQADMQLVPIGSKQGVGVVLGWRLPSFAVVMAKSKDYMVSNAPKVVNGTD